MGLTAAPPRHIEDQHQEALFNWARLHLLPAAPDVEPGAVLADYLYAIPNGGKRGGGKTVRGKNGRRVPLEAVRLKRQGVKAGVSDLHLPLARGGYHSLYIELKAPGGAATKDQRAWLARMRRAGNRAELCVGWEAARAVLLEYMRGEVE